MISSALSGRRWLVVGIVTVLLLLALTHRLPVAQSIWRTPGLAATSNNQPTKAAHIQVLPHVETYFQQVFSFDRPPRYDYPGLKAACDNAPWRGDEVYLRCGGMSAGMTSMVSQVKVCLKMAIDAGANLVLPAMPLRNSADLLDFNIENTEAYMTYDKWFDAEHLISQMGRACPKMKIVHPEELRKGVQVKNEWNIPCKNAFNYQKYHSYFWVGRPYGKFFSSEMHRLEQNETTNPPENASKPGITVVDVDAEFLLFRIANDPSRKELKMWNDLSSVIRYKEQPRQVVNELLTKLHRPFYGVHFRVENDTIWSQDDNQMQRHLEALDEAWTRYARPGETKPLVYLACGDQNQIDKFVAAARERSGWEVTHKWKLLQGDVKMTQLVNDMAFDFQGAIDMGIMVRSEFFMGIQGSAFSWTVANVRDVTGRYRGSSFDVVDDEGARSHLFSEIDADEYACCL
jgi:hypothetical protein